VIRNKPSYDGHGPETVLQFATEWRSDEGHGIEWHDVPIVDLTK
jgi:hypothetical protein